MPAFRWLLAGIILAAVLIAKGVRLPVRHAWPQLAVVGILMIGLGNGAVVWAEQTVPTGLTALLVAASPFWMVGIEQLRPDGDRLNSRRVVGLIMGFSGVALLVWPELHLGEGNGFLLGVGATQLACLGWAVGSSYSRRRDRGENVLAAVTMQMIFAGLMMLVVGSMLGEWQHVTFSARSVIALLYLVIAGSMGGYSAYAYALKHLPLATVSLYAYINPIIAIALGTAVLEEPFNPRLVISAAVVFAGSMLVKQ
jgi:drug/metabolite transporter (DMT)-like permease